MFLQCSYDRNLQLLFTWHVCMGGDVLLAHVCGDNSNPSWIPPAVERGGGRGYRRVLLWQTFTKPHGPVF